MKSNVIKEIDKRNAAFKKATKAEKRVLIAKDVLKQLGQGKMKAKTQTFVSSKRLDTMSDWTSHKYDPDASVQTLFLENKLPDCQCCALGSIALSCILFKNKVNVAEAGSEFCDLGHYLSHGFDTGSGLEKFFDIKQLYLIEAAFEKGRGYFLYGNQLDEAQIDRAVGFGRKYRKTKDRLVAIMKNIVQNKGVFVP